MSIKPAHQLHSSISHRLLRDWNSTNTKVTPENLMYPVFIVEDENAVEEISSMPGISRYGVKTLLNHLETLVPLGLKSILVFGVVTNLEKDERGKNADSTANPVVKALPLLRKTFPDLIIACDVCNISNSFTFLLDFHDQVCLCPYTSHGHCGILTSEGLINNEESIKRIREVAVIYAKAGCHIVAPSDMMDGRVGEIKRGLNKAGLNDVNILSYAAKFSSSFYGPFRDAAKSAPSFGNRRCYQLPPGSKSLALRAVARDVEEGANMLMVKPGMPYLDVLSETKNQFPHYPLFVYQVSGEFAMIFHAAKEGAIDFKKAVMESLIGFRRAGADCIITYFTPQILEWLCKKGNE